MFVLALGNRIVTQMQRNTERRIQLTSQQLAELERKQMETEYQKKSDELIRKLKAQIDEEKIRLQKVEFSRFLSIYQLVFFSHIIGI